MHRESLIAELNTVLASRTTNEWLAELSAAEVPHAPVVPIDEALATPQTAARQLVRTVEDSAGRKYRILGSPIRWQGEPPLPALAPPEIGQHTEEVLREWLGYENEKIAALKAQKAIP